MTDAEAIRAELAAAFPGAVATSSDRPPTTLAEIEAAVDSLEVAPDVVVIADEHALPGSCTPLGDGRFIVHPDTLRELKVAFAPDMAGAGTAMTKGLTAAMGEAVAGAQGLGHALAPLVEMAKREELRTITGRDSSIKMEFGGKVVRIAEPTHVDDAPVGARYVIDEGGSLFGPRGDGEIRQALDRVLAEDAARLEAVRGLWPAISPDTDALKKHRAERKRRKRLAKKSKKANR